jgi:hypothetical protein
MINIVILQFVIINIECNIRVNVSDRDDHIIIVIYQ